MEKATCTAVKAAIAAMDFSAIEAEFGVEITLGARGTFDPADTGSATFKLIVLPVIDGKTITKEETDFRTMAHLYGFQPDDFGRTFSQQGKVFQITGLKPGSPKYPVLAKNLGDGRNYKFPPETVTALLALGLPKGI